MAAAEGEGHRQVAARLDRPPSTVRDWLRRARANAEAVRAAATAALYDFDSTAGAVVPGGSPLADMLEAVGLAVAAAIRRLGPVVAPWQLALTLTRAAILAPAPRRIGVPTG